MKKNIRIRSTLRPVGKHHIRVTTTVSAGNKRRTRSKLIHI